MAEQNYVEYCLFPTEEVSLEDMSTDLLTFAKHFQQNYIWQKDAFHLKPSHTRQQKSKKKKDPMKNAPPHLYYKLHFGDCLDDEWFVVFLLLQISSSKPIQDKYNPIITIQDNDGEFLLIEAAYSLPKWISKPKHAINRVFLYNGSLHLLPRCISIQDPSSFDFTNTGELYNNADSFPEISDAIKFLLNNHKSTLASKTIQTSAFGRIEKFNTALRQFEAGEIDTLQEQHFACVFVPRCIAKLLGQPNFLAQAIQSLYELDFDPQALRIDPKYKKVKNICEFHRSQFPQTNEWVRIRFSRWLYAQLNFFHLPFGKMSVEEEVKMKQQFSGAEMKGILLGRKLEFAFSLLYHKCKMEEDLDYIVYEIERVFVELEGMKNEINAIVDRGELPQDDDEGWLEVSPEEVNDLLSKKQSEADQMKPLDDLMKNMNEFMEGSSGLDGVDFGEDSYSSEDDEFYSGESDEEIRELMKQMDSELKTSDAYGYDFVKTTNDDGETIIDEDVNFMKHLLSSLEEQPLSNPLANLVNSFTL